LTRASLWEAFYARRVYATTCSRSRRWSWPAFCPKSQLPVQCNGWYRALS
jgi:hypothetical protein